MPFEQELLALPLNKLLRLTAILTEMYPEQLGSPSTKGETSKRSASQIASDGNVRPIRLGTFVLALVESNFFAFTAGHVLDASSPSTLLIPVGKKLMPLPCTEAFRSIKGSDGRDLDIAVIPLSASRLDALAQKVFLSLADIYEADMPDRRSLSSFRFVIGFPASRKLLKIDHGNRSIHQSSFQVQTCPPDAYIYQREGLSSIDHLLVEFDRERMMHQGQQHTAPDPIGISGGGIFYINEQTELGHTRRHRDRAPLEAAIDGWKRIKHFLNVARRLNFERPDLFA